MFASRPRGSRRPLRAAVLGSRGVEHEHERPVGLYIDSLDTTGWSKPDGSPVGNYWHVLRGDSSAGIVRARYEVPPSEGFIVSDIKIGGEPIEFAGQIAEHITMKLTGVAAETGQHHADPVGCVDELHAAHVRAASPGLVSQTRMDRGRRAVE